MIMIRSVVLALAWALAAASYADVNSEEDVKRAHGTTRTEASGACVKHSCGAGTEAVPTERALLMLRSIGGCADEGVRLFGPGRGLDLVACCDRVQACAAVCGTTAKMCRDAFDACGERACVKAADPGKCAGDAETVALAMRMDGSRCVKHMRRQNATCDCVDAGDARARREAALGAMLAKYDPAHASPAAAYMEHITDARKFGAAVVKLLAKLPGAVWSVAEPRPDAKHAFGADAADPLAGAKRLIAEAEAKEAAARGGVVDLDRPEL